MDMPIYEFEGKRPRISPNVSFIAESAIIIGDVDIGDGVVIFDNVVIEGFPMTIRIGNNVNIQSGTIIHGLIDSPTIIGDYCTIGHLSLLHGCQLEDYVTVGMHSTVMGYSKVGKGAVIGAKSLIPERKTFSPLALILGHPAKEVKILPESQIEEAKQIAQKYSEHGKQLHKDLHRIL
jgi:carbonic anhydrase/acetyltransferase-like protein (isoleucine patch superfamily)